MIYVLAVVGAYAGAGLLLYGMLVAIMHLDRRNSRCARYRRTFAAYTFWQKLKSLMQGAAFSAVFWFPMLIGRKRKPVWF